MLWPEPRARFERLRNGGRRIALAPELLRQELERAFTLIATEPRVGSPALDKGLEGVRRLFLDRVRYHVYYRLGRDDVIEILAFWHTSRGGGPGLERDTG